MNIFILSRNVLKIVNIIEASVFLNCALKNNNSIESSGFNSVKPLKQDLITYKLIPV